MLQVQYSKLFTCIQAALFSYKCVYGRAPRAGYPGYQDAVQPAGEEPCPPAGPQGPATHAPR